MSRPDTASRRLSVTMQDTFLRKATSNYNYCDSTIEIEIDGKTFSVSRSRLIMRSALFQSLFSLPQATDSEPEKPLPLANVDAQEFQDYLWYIHADPLCAKKFFDSPSSAEKCSRLLGIANVCHQYDAMDVALWALEEALNMLLQRHRNFTIDVNIAHRLLNVASRWQDPEHAKLVSQCRDVVCDALYPKHAGLLSRDPISAVDVARVDPFVLSHVYFYILRKEGYDWKGDARLTHIDRRRLLCGSFALGPAPPRPPALPSGDPLQRAAPADDVFGTPPSSASPAAPGATAQGTPGSTESQSPGRGLLFSKKILTPSRKWTPGIDAEIRSKRNELWEMFDDASWRL